MYHATGGAGHGDMAIKVYKTSILVFKDRDRRVGGLGGESSGGGRIARARARAGTRHEAVQALTRAHGPMACRQPAHLAPSFTLPHTRPHPSAPPTPAPPTPPPQSRARARWHVLAR